MAAGDDGHCWEFWDCPKSTRKNCPAHLIGEGACCWMFGLNMSPFTKRDFRHCWQCPWFKKINPDGVPPE